MREPSGDHAAARTPWNRRYAGETYRHDPYVRRLAGLGVDNQRQVRSVGPDENLRAVRRPGHGVYPGLRRICLPVRILPRLDARHPPRPRSVYPNDVQPHPAFFRFRDRQPLAVRRPRRSAYHAGRQAQRLGAIGAHDVQLAADLADPLGQSNLLDHIPNHGQVPAIGRPCGRVVQHQEVVVEHRPNGRAVGRHRVRPTCVA